MYEDNHYIGDLIAKHILQQLTDQEKENLQQWINADKKNEEWFNEYTNSAQLYEQLNDHDRYSSEKELVWQDVQAKFINRPARRSISVWLRYSAAAAIIVSIAGFWYFKSNHAGDTKIAKKQVITNEIEPGKRGAILTLSNGKSIILDSSNSSSLVREGNILVKNKDGQLFYDASGSTISPDEIATHNTLTTTKGQAYETILSDGSKIWLNASSSIRYPVVFNEQERVVEITGEAYFEVAHRYLDGKKNKVPFIVRIKTNSKEDIGEVQVLGTHFNVNAYEDEDQVQTTLLEGRVNFIARDRLNNLKTSTLQPSQQAILSKSDKKVAINYSPNIEAVMAWKNGRFYFDNASIDVVMHQLEKWYNIQVIYEGAKPTQVFGGELQRSFNLSQTLKALEYTGIRFKIDGRTVIVMK